MNRTLDALDWLFRHTLRSVVFGIVLLALIAAYVAIGSGMSSVREYFEVDELGFFNAWPIKWLAVLMVANLVTVTIQRIPFTRPRYGVWMVHVGIVTLIGGMSWYYGHKVEGSALLLKGRTTRTYYDRFERALYFQAGGAVTRVPLTSLPRFHTYSDETHNADYLDRADLKNLTPVINRGGGEVALAADAVGAKSLTFSVTGYWPYARVRERLDADAKANRVGFTFALPDFGDSSSTGSEVDRILLGGPLSRYSKVNWGPVDFEAKELPDAAAMSKLVAQAKALHTLTITLNGTTQTLPVEVGESYALGQTGYAIRIESFDPNWETIDHQIVPKISFLVAAPKQTFRRMVLGNGLGRPTDFKLTADGPGEKMGPMGKRQKELLDKNLDVSYAFDADAGLLPKNGLGKVLLVTTPGSKTTTVLTVEANAPATVQTFDGDHGTVNFAQPLDENGAIMASLGQQPPRDTFALDVHRTDHAGEVVPFVDDVPHAQRNRDEGSSGRRQVVRVAYDGVDSTDKPFHGTTLVPFSEHPLESPWQGGLVNVPNASAVAQVQLANNFRPLPAAARLDKLEAVAYAGMNPAAAAMIRDYRSTITLTDPVTGVSRTDTVFLNSPVFYGNNNWIFFQSQFDLQNQQWSVLGVGNRPGCYVMVTGCVLIILGIFYAFYVKPILIRRMKQQALAKAKAMAESKPKRSRELVNGGVA